MTLEGEQVGRGELGVVVEHLLEVGDDPVPVRGVAVIAAGEVVADAAAGHLVERRDDHRQGVEAGPGRPLGAAAVLIEQEDEVDRLGELGPAGVLGVEAEAAVLGVELLGQLNAALRGELARQGDAAACAGAGERAADDRDESVGVLLELGPVVAPGVVDAA